MNKSRTFTMKAHSQLAKSFTALPSSSKATKKVAEQELLGMHAALKSLFTAASKEGTANGTARIAAGFYNLRPSADGFDIAPGDLSDEGTAFRQDIYLTCSTSTFLN